MGHFFLNLFVASILIAPGNSLLRVITFSLCMIANIKKLRFPSERFFLVVVFFVILFLSIATVHIRGINYDMNFIVMYLLNFIMLGIFFIDPTKINMLPGLNIANVFIICSTFLYILLVSSFPALEPFFLTSLKGIFLGVPGEKGVLFWSRTSVFHVASPILVFSLALVWYKYLVKKRIKYLLYAFAVFLGLIFSGTRANSFSAVLIIFFIYLHYILFVKKRMLQTVFYAIIAGSLALVGTYLLLIDMNSSSIAKTGHLYSYIELFNNNISYFLFGQGVGAYFFTSGFNREATLTELSYLELIRMFGIFSTIVIIFFYIIPFLKYIKFNSPIFFSIGIAYLAYLFIAGTNPLLIGRTGFIAMWIAYTLPIYQKKSLIIKY